MKKNKKKTKLTAKQNQRIKTLVLSTGLLICCCIVFTLLVTIVKSNSEIYKIDSRIDEIRKEKKSEDSDTGYETIAWLRVQGTNIDTPIVGYENITAFNSIDKDNFLWNNNNSEKFYNQVSVSGHNILNLSSNPESGLEYFSRFEDLMSFVYEDFAEENKYIQYTIDGTDYVYKIFGVFFEKDYNLNLSYKNDYTEEQMNEYIKQVKESSIYDYDVDVESTDSVITLTTCTRMFGSGNSKQFVVVGRLLRDNEKMYNYEMTTNEKYEEIQKLMKGDELDEETQEV